MRKFRCSGRSLAGMALLTGLAACSSKAASHPDAGNPPPDAAHQSCEAGASSSTPPGYVLIDDMETTTHGPILFDKGITSPQTAGYWYNSGAGYAGDAGVPSDTSSPPQMAFVFSAVPSPTTTLNCKPSAYAARQTCALNGLYDTCGVGFEFAQLPDVDAGAPPDPDPDAANVPRYTIPFDISRYKAVTFWGMTTTPASDTGSLHVKISFPDTDTDPRGQICNGGGGNTSKCYNSYATYFEFTTSWQQFTVMLDAGDGGVPATGGIAIDTSWGYQGAQWIPTQVYGINWQAQRNTDPGKDPPLMTDIWIDDVYFVE